MTMRSAVLLATAALASATVATGTYFGPSDPPACHVDSAGRTVVHYKHGQHQSFKCTHQSSKCTCTNTHPTHHKGSCKEFDHTDGSTHGIHGDCSVTGRSPCAGVTCSNGGTCVNGHQTYHCSGCNAGWAGQNCATSVNDCAGVTCSNGGTCIDGHQTYHCSGCNAGWTGQNCATSVNDCAGVTCSNGGTCVDGHQTYHCSGCNAGWSGTLCTVPTSCSVLASSGTVTVGGSTVYCQVGDGGRWALINAWALTYQQTTSSYGTCTASNSMNCKLSDSLINQLAGGRTRTYKLTQGNGYSTNLYLRTDNAYVDTSKSFNIVPNAATTKGRVMSSYSSSAMSSSCNFQYNWIDMRYINCNAMSEYGNDRWFMGHTANDCYRNTAQNAAWNTPDGTRCVNNGYGSPAYGRWGRMNDIRMWIKV